MAEIESPLGRKSFQSSPRPSRMLTVDDPTDELGERFEQPQAQQRQPLRELSTDEVQAYERARAEAKRSQNVISKTARERIEFLTGIGRIKTSFKMDGTTFHLWSLKSGQLEDVLDTMIAMGGMNDAKFNFELRRQTLARSLVSIDDMSVEEIIGTNDFAQRLELIRSLDENLIDYMYKHYEEKILKVSKNKYALNTEKDVEEVVEAVKK